MPVTAFLTFFSRDPSLGIRLLCVELIGLTCPLNFPMVLILSCYRMAMKSHVIEKMNITAGMIRSESYPTYL
ncbi:GhoT/OrtT family toxin [Sodalis-like endosymbiont of Proechinophthirus fluctus]|uniref:GhoT/OrtT family toxin n=1 Tax=Sodalis-like endosymbiont of Proechinophthirus fluctus TaxID=1462730 RepID=UPI00093FF528|nr:GhoT/OrtT family toxin [Sodalis-like endosymbiont of Proechinophthirus fluctus]